MDQADIDALAQVIDARAFEPFTKPDHLVTQNDRQTKAYNQLVARGVAQRILNAGYRRQS